jgi:hypothetical protein
MTGSRQFIAYLLIEAMGPKPVMTGTQANLVIPMVKRPSLGLTHQSVARASQTIGFIHDDTADLRIRCRDQRVDTVDVDPTDDPTVSLSVRNIEADRPLRQERSKPFRHLVGRGAISELNGERSDGGQIPAGHRADLYTGDVAGCG